MAHASFEASISNLCRELVESMNDLEVLQERKREIQEVLDERILVLRRFRQRESHNLDVLANTKRHRSGAVH